jgi:hypothetical protein
MEKMNHLVEVRTDSNGDIYEPEERVWCVASSSDVVRTLCGLTLDEYCKFEEKVVQRGGITCAKCFTIVKEIKSIKL